MITSCERCNTAVVIPDDPDNQPSAVLCKRCQNVEDSGRIAALSAIAGVVVIAVAIGEKIVCLTIAWMSKFF